MADNDPILISGATGCIGSTLARSLYADGRALVLFGRDPERLGKLAAELPGAEVLVGDIGHADTLAGNVEFPARLAGVVHAAGICQGRPFAESDPAIIREHLEVNLVGPSELTRLALPALRAARGTVVLVNSLVGLYPWPGWIGYAMSKYGLRAFAETLRLEEFETGVRVSSIFASRVATPLQAKVHAQEGKEYVPEAWVQPETMARTIRNVLETPHDAELKDITLMHQQYPRP
ncbi:SDR family NAD(P)-dependent oxidoreductase [Kribbella sp. NPDC051620]|uniref:SDR family NAD(P)-dependent oxidoreductase n=1 Tax=Kribbella sp. NPDC051620 TaxID=3364120 RepID=UPI0037A8F599